MESKGHLLKVPPFRLREIKTIFLEEGFRHTRFQFWEKGQIFGLVKRLSFKKQLHIRAFIDGTIKAEEEIWRFFIPFHFIISPNVGSAVQKIMALLRKYKIASL